MTDNLAPEVKPKRKIFFGLFIFPLLIAVGMAILLCTIVLLTREDEAPESLITAIKTGSPSKRWQKAYELANELNVRGPALRDTGIMREVIHILQDGAHYDEKTRGYMALALGHFKTPEAVAALRKVLADESVDIQVYSLWSLGMLEAREAVPDILPLLREESAEVKKTAIYVLGALGSAELIPELENYIEDENPDIKWNAALALARLGSRSGKAVLLGMLEREKLEIQNQLPETAIEKIMINAVKGAALIADEECIAILENLSKTDKNLRVRQAAMDALKAVRAEK